MSLKTNGGIMARKNRRRKFKFGVEYTFVPTKRTANKLNRAPSWEGLSDYYARVGRKLKRELNPWAAHNDDGALETPSRPMTSMKKHREWVEKLFRRMKKEGLTARRIDRERNEEVYYGTGGGHIHVEMPNHRTHKMEYLKYVQNLSYIAINYPFLGWFMNEFMDDDNAECLHYRRNESYLKRVRSFANGIYPGTEYEPIDLSFRQVINRYPRDSMNYIVSRSIHSLGSAVMIRSRTVEFRFFDAPRNPKMALEHLELAKALHRVCSGNLARPVPIGKWANTKYGAKSWYNAAKDEVFMKREWKKLIEDLGLSWRTYSKYYQNYLDRKEFGKLN